MSESWSACSQAGHGRDELGGPADRVGRGRVGLDRDHVFGTHLVGGDVDPAAVDHPVPVADELAGLAPRGGEAEPDQHVVEAGLEQPQQVLAGDAVLPRSLVVVGAELFLQHLVVAARLLLLAQLHPVLGLPHAPAAVLAGRVGAALDAALVGEAALALEEELLALAAALLALGGGVASHLDPPPLFRAAAVVGLRGDVLDRGHVEAGGLQRADRGLAAGAGALGEDLDLLEAVLHALFGGRVGGHLGGERGRLARAFEPGRAGRLPGDHVAVGVGQGDDRVVEGSLDVRLPVGDVLFDAAPGAPFGGFFRCGHRLSLFRVGALRLPATLIRRGPLRPRALVFVRWPRTGRPRRWRRPR